MKRRCGFLPPPETSDSRPVWTRRRVHTEICPKSLVTAQSIAWLEEYVMRKKNGGGPAEDLPARKLEAFLVIETELAEEIEEAKRSASRQRRSVL